MSHKHRVISIVTSNEESGKTVAHILKKRLGISESILRRIRVANAGTMLDGSFCRTDAPVQAGQVISINLTQCCPETSIEPQAGPIDISYEDEDLLIMDKPAGIVVHPSRGHKDGTLCNYVSHYLSEKGEHPVPHPVNRLDRETTGLVVFAKHAHAQNRLAEDLHTDRFERHYLAICEGITPPAGVIDAPIARITDVYGSFGIREDGKRALTRFKTLSHFNGGEGKRLSLVELTLETGRTHQIRVHMSHIGHPLLGDTAYGQASPLISRPALHSWKLSLIHPITQETLKIESPVPQDMAQLARLEQDLSAGAPE